jgi:hypothetical protein
VTVPVLLVKEKSEVVAEALIDPTPVTAPVPPLNDVTPVFENWMAPEELASPIPVEVANVKGELKVNPPKAMVAVAFSVEEVT